MNPIYTLRLLVRHGRADSIGPSSLCVALTNVPLWRRSDAPLVALTMQ